MLMGGVTRVLVSPTSCNTKDVNISNIGSNVEFEVTVSSYFAHIRMMGNYRLGKVIQKFKGVPHG